MAYTKYSLTPANNNAAPPDGAPEGMLPSAVNDTMRDMMAQIRDCGDGIRGGTYTMTAPVITGGSINGATVGASTASTGAFTTLAYTGTLTGGTGVVNLGSGQFYKDASGNVGIGTSSPAVPLHLSNTQAAFRATSTTGENTAYLAANNTGGYLYLGRENSTGATFGFGAYAGVIYSTGAYPLVFGVNDAERMRIDSSGNLLVGLTSTDSDLKISAPCSASVVAFGAKAAATTTSYAALFRNPNGTVGSIQIAGSSTSYVTSSDYRLKENIAPMTGALDVVQQLKPVTYNWKADGSSGQGFIAHELQAVVPDCVTGEKDAVDAEGKPVYQGIDTSFLVATLTAAIKEQQVMIEELKAKVAALEAA